MKFTYQYRSKDNVLHRGVVKAVDKDSAYAQLRERGIKASRLDEAPGFLNKLFGKGKRWIAIAILSMALAVSLLSYFNVSSTSQSRVRQPSPPSQFSVPDTSQRHQIYGDPVIIEDMVANGYASVFSNDGERYLAAYAMPGSELPEGALRLQRPDVLATALTNTVSIAVDDPREVAELKAIVNGMKDELREYLADGEGTCASFMRRLDERQEEERLIYKRVLNELENNPDQALWEERNRSLREMGIRTVPRPRERKRN